MKINLRLLMIVLLFGSQVKSQGVTYCTPVVDEPCVFSEISEVSIGTMVNNSSGNCLSGYADYSADKFIISRPGSILNFEIQTSTGGFQQNVNIYIDYNSNGDFNDPGELVASSIYDGFVFAAGSFSIPALQDPGSYRLRVISTGINEPAEACHTTTGEVEDYTLIIVLANCIPVVSNACSNNININNVVIGVVENGNFYTTLSNSSGCDGYTVYPPTGSTVTKAAPGKEIGVQVETQFPVPARVDVYLDFNGNGDFNDPGDHLFTSGMQQSLPAYQTFVLPASLTPGNYPMRIIAQNYLATNIDPCFSENGEIEDYTLIVEPCTSFTADIGLFPGSTSSICVGETTTLQVSILNPTAPYYIFNYSDGVSSNGYVSSAIIGQDLHVPIPVSPTSTTTYTIESLFDPYRCPGSFSGDVIITVGELNITPSATITQPTCSVPTGTITLDIPSGAGYNYSIGGAYQSSPVFSNLPAGLYTLSLQSSGGCVSTETTTVTINDQPLPPAAPGAVSGLVNVCAFVGTNTPLTYSVSPDPNASGYQWLLPPSVNLVSGQGTNSITVTIGAGFINSANKLIKVKALSTCGNSGDKLLYLKAQLPSTPGNIIASSNNICPFLGTNSPVTYSIPRVPSASSYIWTAQSGNTVITHPNGLGENDTLVTVTFSSGFSTSSLTVQAVNDCGTSAIRSFTITRSSPATPGLISGPVNICAHLAPNGVPATYSVGSVGTVENYSWTLPAGASAVIGQGSSTVSILFPPDYNSGAMTVRASNGCGTSGPRNLAVTRLNPATPSVIDVIQVQDCPARRFVYSITSIPSNATGVQWVIPPGATLVSGGGTSSIQVEYPAGAIIGTVSVTASNNCANSSTRTTQVRLPACPPEFAGKNGTIRQDLIYDDMQPAEIRIYPNPSASEFRIHPGGMMSSPMNIRVLDAGGRLMSRFRTIPGQQNVFGADLKPGIYFVEIICDSGKMIRKIVKS